MSKSTLLRNDGGPTLSPVSLLCVMWEPSQSGNCKNEDKGAYNPSQLLALERDLLLESTRGDNLSM
jgi:hypothetical protein